jgi:hypothetical protein
MFVFSDRMRQSGPGKTSSESDESTAARSLGDEVRHDRDDKVLPGLGGVVIPALANGDLQRLPVDVVLPETAESDSTWRSGEWIAAAGRERLERAGLPVAAKNPIHGCRAHPDERGDLVVGAALLAKPEDDSADLRGRRWSHDHGRSRPADRIKRVRR